MNPPGGSAIQLANALLLNGVMLQHDIVRRQMLGKSIHNAFLLTDLPGEARVFFRSFFGEFPRMVCVQKSKDTLIHFAESSATHGDPGGVASALCEYANRWTQIPFRTCEQVLAMLVQPSYPDLVPQPSSTPPREQLTQLVCRMEDLSGEESPRLEKVLAACIKILRNEPDLELSRKYLRLLEREETRKIEAGEPTRQVRCKRFQVTSHLALHSEETTSEELEEIIQLGQSLWDSTQEGRNLARKIAHLLEKAGQRTEAITWYRRALAHASDKNEQDAQSELAKCLMRSQDSAERQEGAILGLEKVQSFLGDWQRMGVTTRKLL